MDEKDMTLEQVEAELEAQGIKIPACAGKYIKMAADAYAARDQAQAACAAMHKLLSSMLFPPLSRAGHEVRAILDQPNPGQPLLDRLATQAKEIEDLRAAIEAMARDVLLVGIVNQEPHVGKWEYTIVKAGLHSGWEGPYNTAADAALAGVEATKKEK